MIIIQVAGGLGNQLQQYALYRKFLKLGREARLDFSWFNKAQVQEGKNVTKRELELAFFEGLFFQGATPEEKRKLVGNENFTGKIRRKIFPFTVHEFRESQMYHPELLTFENMYIQGYFACEKYYADILRELREDICFPESNNPANTEMIRRMENCESVSVHFRRGDYLDPVNADMFGNICTEAYYQGAMELLKRDRPGAHFFMFSDDPEYVKARFQGKDFTIVDINHGKDSFYDIKLMSSCRHQICANSTFGFWGARLNGKEDKIMIRPALHKNSQTFVKKEMENLWRYWRFVDANGQEL